MDIKRLQDFLQNFADERDWNQFHSPKNLSMALAGECGELLEIFQWLSPHESSLENLGPQNKQAVKEELADIFIYTIRMASILGIDLEKASWEKMEKNAIKYPVIEKGAKNPGFNR